MQVKRITAPNMRQALQIVREQLGEDAIILSNRRVPDGIELICSLEAPELVAAGPLKVGEMRDGEHKMPARREQTTLEKGITEWEQDSRARARAIELSLRQKLADKGRVEKARPGSAADIYEQRAASMAGGKAQPAVASVSTSASSGGSAQRNAEQGVARNVATNVATNATTNAATKTDLTQLSAAARKREAGAAGMSELTGTPVDLKKFTGVVTTPNSAAPRKDSAESHAAEVSAGHSSDASRSNGVEARADGVRRPDVDRRNNDEVDALRNELQSLRNMLQGQFQHMAWMNLTQKEPARAEVWKRLCRLGFDAECIQQLLEGVTAPNANRLWHEALKQLLGKLPVAGGDMVSAGGVFAFVGPTGAGKTTTIGKLAARAVLQHGADNVVLVTTDTYRVAGHEQLRIFGRILGVKVVVVDDIARLPKVVEQHARHHLVLIDTAGLSARDERLQTQLSVLSSMGARIKTFLVMPCSLQAQTQNKAFELYGAASPCGVVLTKLDESATLGEVLSLVLRKHLPVCYVADGQQVPQDVHVATAREIVQRAVLSRSTQNPDDGEMAEAYWQATQRGATVSMQVA